MAGTVQRLASAPVKGMALLAHETVHIDRTGIEGDRTYALVDPRGLMVNGKRIGPLATIVPELGRDPNRLRLHFPDGRVVEDDVTLGGVVSTVFFGLERPAREVDGPFSAAISAWAGQPLRLVRMVAPNGAIDRANISASISILSAASLGTLSTIAGLELDPRRFRMSVIVEDVPAYAEDAWVGGRLRIGSAILRPSGGLARCVVPGQDPDTGLPTTDVLGILKRTRSEIESTEKAPFGIWAEVLEPGEIRLGDPVVPLTD